MLPKSSTGVNLHHIPVHRKPLYENQGFKSGDFREAGRFQREIISLPVFSGLLAMEQKLLIDVSQDFFQS